MSINFSLPKSVELKPRIVVIGVGGAGGNAVNNMIASGLEGVDFIVANTDAQALSLSKAERRIQMGGAITEGLGAGMRPEIGAEAAENSLAEIMEHLDGAHMLFVAAGMGGGTGTGAAPIIAQAARERGILTVAIVTKPFQFEGSKRMKLAEAGIDQLYSSVDTLLIIPNQNLFRVATENTTMTDAFSMADEVLNSGVRGITDLMVVPGIINLDFADVRTVMAEMGKAMMGTGEATGERRAVEAAESAISNPLLDDVSLKGAKGVLINITGGSDLTLYEVDEAASLIRAQVDPNANIIVGSALNGALDGIVRVSVVATGVDSAEVFAGVTPRAETTIVIEDKVDDWMDIKDEIESAEPEIEPEIDVAVAAEQINVPAPEPIAPAPAPTPVPYQYQQPATQAPIAPPAPAPIARAPSLPPVETQTVVKRPFGFFGRKKTKPAAPVAAPKPASNNTGDLFGSDMEDELEIPSFLRR